VSDSGFADVDFRTRSNCLLLDRYRIVCQWLRASVTNGYFNKAIEFESDLPVQLNPSPVNPGRQLHVKLPGTLMQVAKVLQLSFLTEHSSISTPSHVKI